MGKGVIFVKVVTLLLLSIIMFGLVAAIIYGIVHIPDSINNFVNGLIASVKFFS